MLAGRSLELASICAKHSSAARNSCTFFSRLERQICHSLRRAASHAETTITSCPTIHVFSITLLHAHFTHYGGEIQTDDAAEWLLLEKSWRLMARSDWFSLVRAIGLHRTRLFMVTEPWKHGFELLIHGFHIGRSALGVGSARRIVIKDYSGRRLCYFFPKKIRVEGSSIQC